jgi:hypothetical protein
MKTSIEDGSWLAGFFVSAGHYYVSLFPHVWWENCERTKHSGPTNAPRVSEHTVNLRPPRSSSLRLGGFFAMLTVLPSLGLINFLWYQQAVYLKYVI